uniref:Uncharacterized protein n=1 Tax=Knipowitschia caucasica TaxID=637954 RepID=A0AAV2JSK5_KNICA
MHEALSVARYRVSLILSPPALHVPLNKQAPPERRLVISPTPGARRGRGGRDQGARAPRNHCGETVKDGGATRPQPGFKMEDQELFP